MKQGPVQVGDPQNHEGTVMVITHGGWHSPEHYLPLAQALFKRGYPSILPRLDAANTALSFEDDAQTVLDSCQGLDNIYLVGHSRGNEPLVRLPEYTDVRRLVGLTALGWGGPHHFIPKRLNLSDLRYKRKVRTGIIEYDHPKGVSSFDPEVAEKVFWSLLKDQRLLDMAKSSLQDQRNVKPHDTRPEHMPEEIPATSVVGLRDNALFVPLAIHVNHKYFGRQPKLTLWDHSPVLSAIEQTADLITKEAEAALKLKRG